MKTSRKNNCRYKSHLSIIKLFLKNNALTAYSYYEINNSAHEIVSLGKAYTASKKIIKTLQKHEPDFLFIDNENFLHNVIYTHDIWYRLAKNVHEVLYPLVYHANKKHIRNQTHDLHKECLFNHFFFTSFRNKLQAGMSNMKNSFFQYFKDKRHDHEVQQMITKLFIILKEHDLFSLFYDTIRNDIVEFYVNNINSDMGDTHFTNAISLLSDYLHQERGILFLQSKIHEIEKTVLQLVLPTLDIDINLLFGDTLLLNKVYHFYFTADYKNLFYGFIDEFINAIKKQYIDIVIGYSVSRMFMRFVIDSTDNDIYVIDWFKSRMVEFCNDEVLTIKINEKFHEQLLKNSSIKLGIDSEEPKKNIKNVKSIDNLVTCGNNHLIDDEIVQNIGYKNESVFDVYKTSNEINELNINKLTNNHNRVKTGKNETVNINDNENFAELLNDKGKNIFSPEYSTNKTKMNNLDRINDIENNNFFKNNKETLSKNFDNNKYHKLNEINIDNLRYHENEHENNKIIEPSNFITQQFNNDCSFDCKQITPEEISYFYSITSIKTLFESEYKKCLATRLLTYNSDIKKEKIILAQIRNQTTKYDTHRIEMMIKDFENKIYIEEHEILFINTYRWPGLKNCKYNFDERLIYLQNLFSKNLKKNNIKYKYEFIYPVSICEVEINNVLIKMTVIQYQIILLILEKERTIDELKSLCEPFCIIDHINELFYSGILISKNDLIFFSEPIKISKNNIIPIKISFTDRKQKVIEKHESEIYSGQLADAKIINLLKSKKSCNKKNFVKEIAHLENVSNEFVEKRIISLISNDFIEEKNGNYMYLP